MAPIVPIVLAAARLYKFGKKPGKKAMAYIMRKKKAMKAEKKIPTQGAGLGERKLADELRIQARMKFGPKMKPKSKKELASIKSDKFIQYVADTPPFGPGRAVITRGTDSMRTAGFSASRPYNNLIKAAEKAKKYETKKSKFLKPLDIKTRHGYPYHLTKRERAGIIVDKSFK